MNSEKYIGLDVEQKIGRQNTSDATDFLIKYKEAWETHNADLAAGLFTRDAEYRQDPFGPAIVGREAIHDYWAGATGRQAEIHFTVGTFIP